MEKLDPTRLSSEALNVLEIIEASNFPPFESLSLDDMRKVHAQMSEKLGGKILPVDHVEEVTIADNGNGGKIHLRLYSPNNISSDGAIIYIHGGGWCVGSIYTHDKICRRLASTSNLKVISVAYRLAPEFPAPNGPLDVISAVEWIVDNPDRFGIDKDKLAIAGDSAGGSLAAVTTQQLKEKVNFKAQVLFYPSTDLSFDADHYSSKHRNAAYPPLTIGAYNYMIDFFIDNHDRNDTLVSPLRAKEFTGLPPALILTGECDILLDEGFLYAEKLKKSNIEVEYIEEKGMIHGFIEMAGALSVSRKAFIQAGEFINKKFR